MGPERLLRYKESHGLVRVVVIVVRDACTCNWPRLIQDNHVEVRYLALLEEYPRKHIRYEDYGDTLIQAKITSKVFGIT
jgi:hypothetical protein